MPVHKLTAIPSYSSSLSDVSEGSGESGLENYAEKITLHATTTTRLPRRQWET